MSAPTVIDGTFIDAGQWIMWFWISILDMLFKLGHLEAETDLGAWC